MTDFTGKARATSLQAEGVSVTSAIIAAWENHGSRAKQIAAVLARELEGKNPGDRIDSSVKIAARLGVSRSIVETARNHLMGARIIRKSRGHYCVA